MIALPVYDVSLNCINHAAIYFHVPAKLIIAVLVVENGRIGKISQNQNGSYDIGLMQINSRWISTLKKYGITEEKLKFDACTNINVGAWILSKNIAHSDSLASGIGDYNSHTYQYNHIYFNKVKKTYAEINRLLG